MNGGSSVEQLYAHAAVMTDAGARAAYLREACGGDLSLCRQVEALFAFGDDSVAEAPLVNRQAAFRLDDVGERTGDQIGPYALRRRLGERAFGVVLLDDLGRDVEGRRQLTPDVESALRDMLSFIYRETGDYEKALHHGTRGLELARRQADDPRRLASFLVTLGEVNKELDQYELAARHLEECVTLRRAFSGEDHPQTIRAVLTLGRVRYQAGDQAAGIAIVSEVLATARSQEDKPWGRDQLVRCLNMMEILLRDENRAAEALVLNRERLHLNRTHQGADHPETLLSQTHLGALLTQLGHLEEARGLLTTTLRSGRLQLGDDYPLTLETMPSPARPRFA